MSRLAPIERPNTLVNRIAYWFTRRQYGVVLSPMRVIYARKARLAFLGQHIASTMEKGLSLDDDLVGLVVAHVAQVNGCAFCLDFNLARAVQKRLGLDRFSTLSDYKTSPLFSERERAALAFCEEAAKTHSVREATFKSARVHFGDTELVELAWLVAAETYFNIQSGIFEFGSDGLAERQRP